MVTDRPGPHNGHASDARRTALGIAARGKAVFPVRPGRKDPCYDAATLRHGRNDATTDPDRIAEWWERWPSANIGIPTGPESGLVVLDLDTYKPGAMTLEEVEEEYGPVSQTATVRTGAGGLQFFFEHPGEHVINSAGKLGTHVDTRGDGGYAVVPPSVTTGRYEWINKVPPAPVPPKLLSALRGLREKPRQRGASEAGPRRDRASAALGADASEAGPIPDGERNQTLTRIAGRLHDGTRDLGQLEGALLAVNDARGAPPLPAAEVRKIAASVHRYEPCRPASREPDAETVAALAAFERDVFAREWKGKGGKTKYSMAVAALKLAREHGRRSPVPGGVELDVSHRQWALAAACSRRSIVRNLKVMTDMFRQENEGAGDGTAGTIVLLCDPAPIVTTQPTELLIGEKPGGCDSWRAPLTAPRRRWSTPKYRGRRGVTPGTTRVRSTPAPKKRDAVVRMGKGTEPFVDTLEAAGGTMTLADLAAAVGVKRPRDLTRRKDPETGKGRDGPVTLLEAAGIVRVDGDAVSLPEDWLEALNHDREVSGELALHRRDMAKYNRERTAYRNRRNAPADPAPTGEEIRDLSEGFPERRRRAIEEAIGRLFRERPQFRERRVGQITCQVIFDLPEDFPRGDLGPPTDAEVGEILEENGAAA